MPYRRHYGPSMHGQLYDGGDYPGMLAVLAPTLGELDSEAERLKRAGEIAGVGLAMYLAHSGVSAHESVTLEAKDGGVTVITSLTEIGQGLDQVLQDNDFDALGIPGSLVTVKSGEVG